VVVAGPDLAHHAISTISCGGQQEWAPAIASLIILWLPVHTAALLQRQYDSSTSTMHAVQHSNGGVICQSAVLQDDALGHGSFPAAAAAAAGAAGGAVIAALAPVAVVTVAMAATAAAPSVCHVQECHLARSKLLVSPCQHTTALTVPVSTK
jgi:hypothetical protein